MTGFCPPLLYRTRVIFAKEEGQAQLYHSLPSTSSASASLERRVDLLEAGILGVAHMDGVDAEASRVDAERVAGHIVR